MTYKQQQAWLGEVGFIQREHSLVWLKSYETFNVELWQSKTGVWKLSIVDWADDIPLFSLPDDFDFNKLTPLIKCYDELEQY